MLVVGSGLIGTSLGLALRRRGVAVHLRDRDPRAVRLAVRRSAGDAGPPASPPAMVVVAVPPDHVPGAVIRALLDWPEAVVTDVGSVKEQPLTYLRRADVDHSRYVGSHPMAGSEKSGPLAACAELFAGRAWAVTPHPGARPAAIDAVEALVRACDAEPVTMTPRAHDEAVARVSHLPHLLAVLAAARLPDAPNADLRLSGQGLRDVTRVAAGDPALWRQILTANAAAVVDLLTEVRGDLDCLIGGLGSAEPALDRLLHRGLAGTRAIPRPGPRVPTRLPTTGPLESFDRARNRLDGGSGVGERAGVASAHQRPVQIWIDDPTEVR